MPPGLITIYRRVKVARLRRANRGKSVKEVFTHIYEGNVWGGEAKTFCSGGGSRQQHATLYAEMVRSFIGHNSVRSMVDLGCGDFVVGQKLQVEGVDYTGVDIVDSLIAHHQRAYEAANTHFVCKDIIADELPQADLCLIRQVLQHLSNAQILAILRKVRQYPYVLITEHYPAASKLAVPNVDKPAGGDIRVNVNSAVCLEEPPFNLQNLALMLEVAVDEIELPGETLRTYLIRH